METTKTLNTHISFKDTGYFSKLICDYLDRKDSIKPLYQNNADIAGFEKQIALKQASFSNNKETRLVLVEALKKQYKSTNTSQKTNQNIQSLLNENTFTVTTGHQLNLFTGPLYFLYKIVTVINLSKTLKASFPNKNFIPVYWMATEDHDFDEINFFNFKGNKIQWSQPVSGAVGRLSTDGLEAVFDTFFKQLDGSQNALKLKELFEKAYLEHDNLTDATRYLANELFGMYSLVILDGDDSSLKQLFSETVKDELCHQTCFKAVTKSSAVLSQLNYKVQVNPREINLFYIKNNIRARIVYEGGHYKVIDTAIQFSKEDVLEEVDKHPERFSPNVLMRPLYQETILPNLSYTGGGGELAYWLQLKAYFESRNVPLPILLIRNSVVVITSKQLRKLDKLNLKAQDLFLKQQGLINKTVKKVSEINIDFSAQRAQLQEMFFNFKQLATQTDKSFIGAVNAQEKKQLKGLDVLEKRLLKAQKRKYSELTQRITLIQNEIFPKQSLQERTINFSELYLKYGDDFIPQLMAQLNPLAQTFSILEI